MPKERFPLRPLEFLRKAKAEQRKEAFGKERGKVSEATERRLTSERQLDAERLAAQRLAEVERERLTSEGARGTDLQRLQAYREGSAQRLEQLEQSANLAQAAEAKAKQALQFARSQLSDAEAQHRAVQRHRERFEQEARRKQEGAEEEASADIWLARRERGPV